MKASELEQMANEIDVWPKRGEHPHLKTPAECYIAGFRAALEYARAAIMAEDELSEPMPPEMKHYWEPVPVETFCRGVVRATKANLLKACTIEEE